MQEFLNHSVQHRWGFVSNGLRLVVLHDNVSLVRASNVEFDLEAMFEGEVYSDFFLLFSLCHQSRVEILAEERPEECWLEKWSKLAEEQGTRAREKLRVGVERAIQPWAGLAGPPGGTRIERGPADGNARHAGVLPRAAPDDLPNPAAACGRGTSRWRGTRTSFIPRTQRPKDRRRYAQYYSLGRLRKLASQRRGTAHSDLYESLKIVFEKLRAGYASLAIPGLGSFLFCIRATPHLDEASLANEYLLEAIRHLCYTGTSRDAVAPCSGLWTSATWDRRSWGRSTSRFSSCTPASTPTRDLSFWP